MAKISVIIPCYNAQNHISKCLCALSLQTFKDFEVILVDDYSTDNTIETIKSYMLKCSISVKYILNQVNLGPSKSRLNGALSSDSEWITFCDSDDWYEPTYLASMIEKAESDDCDVVFCGYQNVIGKKKDRHPLSDTELVQSSKDALLLNVDSLCMMIVKRSVFLQIPQPDIRNGEDMAIVPLLILKSRRVGVLSKILYNYYLRSGSASQNPSYKMIDSLIQSYNHICTHLSDDYYQEKEYIGIRNLVYACLLNLFKFTYDIRKASEILNEFDKSYPQWGKCSYLDRLPKFKRIYVWCANKRLYFVLYLLSHIHSCVLNKIKI